jgi:uncharacterized membrane protein YhaH (DUF805 family)
MNTTQAVKSGFVKYVNFRDRACRSEFWRWTLFVSIVGRASASLDRALNWHGWALSDLVTLVTLVPSVAVAFRRLHDINRSGWWALVFWVPWIGSSVWVDTIGADGINGTGWVRWSSVVISISFLIGIIFFIVVGCIKGTDGPNRFGPDPLANQSSGQDWPETRPVARVKANDGYFKKCSGCGKFTRDAKVCRNCGRDLAHGAIDASPTKGHEKPPNWRNTAESAAAREVHEGEV